MYISHTLKGYIGTHVISQYISYNDKHTFVSIKDHEKFYSRHAFCHYFQLLKEM